MNSKAKDTISQEAPLRAQHQSKHPFAAVFLDLGDHTAEDALEALTEALKAEKKHDENAYEWVQQALPGATMKPGHAFGTLGEIYKSYTRGQEYIRFTGVLGERH
jgi:hypothetical protein